MEYFFKRLEAYIEVRPTAAMTDIIVKIMVEVLSILGIVTKEIGQGQMSTYFSLNMFAKINSRLPFREVSQEIDWQERCRRRPSTTGPTNARGGSHGCRGSTQDYSRDRWQGTRR